MGACKPLQSWFRSLASNYLQQRKEKDVMTQPRNSRDFRGRRAEARTERIPPGQHLTSDFPVLSAGPTPPYVEPVSWTVPTQEQTTHHHSTSRLAQPTSGKTIAC
jgi:hypothetical protein